MILKYPFAVMLSVTGLLYLANCLAAHAESTAQTPQAKSGGQDKRAIYAVKNRDAKELAAVLDKHFKGQGGLSVLPHAGSNNLIITASASQFDDVIKAVDTLDRRLRDVSVEVFILQVKPQKGPDGKLQPGEVDLTQLAGKAEAVRANIKAMDKKGLFVSVEGYFLKTEENKSAYENKLKSLSYITGMVTIGGKTTRTVLYHSVGTTVRATARIAPDDFISLDLHIEDRRALQPEDGILLGIDDEGRQVMVSEFANEKLDAKITLAAGQALLAKDVRTMRAGARTLVIVAAFASPSAKAEAAQTKQIIYTAQHRSAADLAGLLTKQFKGDTSVQVVADRASNTLLVSANAGVLDAVSKTLRTLDRRPQDLVVEVIVLPMALVKDKDGKVGPPKVDLNELSGPAAQVLANIKAMQTKGYFAAVDHLELTAEDGQTTNLINGSNKPYIKSILALGKEIRPLSQYKNVGTTVTVTPRVGTDRVIELDLRLKDDRMVQPADGKVLGNDADGKEVRATAMVAASLQTKMQLPAGHAVLATDVQMKSEVAGAKTLFVVSAKVAQ